MDLGGFWLQKFNEDTVAAQISQQRGKHYLKAGFEIRKAEITVIQ